MSGSEIPDKIYYKIGEVSSILGVKPYVVRFWESEFNLVPPKTQSRHRIYRRQDLDVLMEIRHLLYEDRFTIEGARNKLKERLKERNKQLSMDWKTNPYKDVLRQVKKDLSKIRELLRS
jgi:DNA-binding transcriptional MerR regulator